MGEGDRSERTHQLSLSIQRQPLTLGHEHTLHQRWAELPRITSDVIVFCQVQTTYLYSSPSVLRHGILEPDCWCITMPRLVVMVCVGTSLPPPWTHS